MRNRFKGKKDQLADDMKLAQEIKPKLREFVIKEQVKKAEETNKEQKKEADAILSSAQVIDRVGKLSCVAFFEVRVWETIPPYLSMPWLNKAEHTQKDIDEMNMDVSAFATYLAREYNLYLKYRGVDKGYPNPLLEENLMTFWGKFNTDLKFLIEAEKARVAKGNQSVILTTGNQDNHPLDNIIVPGGVKRES